MNSINKFNTKLKLRKSGGNGLQEIINQTFGRFVAKVKPIDKE